MRAAWKLLTGCLLAGGLLAGPGLAKSEKAGGTCDVTARLVAETVAARAAGKSKAQARKPLAATLGAEAGGVLVEWVWTLRQEQLTPAVGQAWKEQCEAQ